jgi:hypothetical protein
MTQTTMVSRGRCSLSSITVGGTTRRGNREDNREAELQYLDELPAGAQLANAPVRVLAFGNIGLCG